MTMNHPQSYEILLVPEFTEGPAEALKAKNASEASGTPESADAAWCPVRRRPYPLCRRGGHRRDGGVGLPSVRR